MKRVWIIGLIVLLAAGTVLEWTRRYGATWTCYIELRYSTYRVGDSKDEAWDECKSRHLYWPFGL